MKKFLLGLIMVLGLLIVGCTSIVKKVEVENIKIAESKLVKIEKITPYPNSLHVFLSNESDEVVEIVWDRSKIDGATPFLKGKYIDAGKAQPNDIIAPQDKANFDIHSSDKVTHVGYWMVGDLNYPVKLILCIKRGDKEEFVISEVKAKIVEEETK